MSRIYEALKKAQESSDNEEMEHDFRDFDLFNNGRSAPKINFELGQHAEEEYQKLRRHLLTGPKSSEIKVIMVAATHHGEGATTTAAILASMLAKTKNSRILLIDANFRTPALEDLFHGQENGRGLTDLMLANESLDDLVYQTNLPNLYVLPCGRPVGSPSYVFESDSLASLLGKLRERFDYIIFDASPLDHYAESTFLASQVDGVILVVEAEKTRTEVAQRIKKDLETTDAKILGVVLNKKKNYIPPVLDRLL